MPKTVIMFRSRANDSSAIKVANTLAQKGYFVQLHLWDRQKIPGTPAKHDNVKILNFNLKAPYDRLSILFYFPFWWIYELVTLFKERYDVVHAFDLDTLYPALIAGKLKKKKIVYTIFDYYANNLPNGKFQLLREILRRSFSFVENLGICFTDLLILVDENRIEEVQGAKIKKLIFVYNAPPDMQLKYKTRIGKPGEFTIFYGGSINEIRGIPAMIDAVKQLDGVNLVLAGDIPDSNMYKYISAEKTNITYLGWIPTYDELLAQTCNADLLFRFSNPEHPKTKYESPSKLFEAMMCGKPILVSDHSRMANIVRQEQCGIVVPFGDISVIRKTIANLKINKELIRTLGENGRKAYIRKYSWDIMENRLLNAYEEIIICN